MNIAIPRLITLLPHRSSGFRPSPTNRITCISHHMNITKQMSSTGFRPCLKVTLQNNPIHITIVKHSRCRRRTPQSSSSQKQSTLLSILRLGLPPRCHRIVKVHPQEHCRHWNTLAFTCEQSEIPIAQALRLDVIWESQGHQMRCAAQDTAMRIREQSCTSILIVLIKLPLHVCNIRLCVFVITNCHASTFWGTIDIVTRTSSSLLAVSELT